MVQSISHNRHIPATILLLSMLPIAAAAAVAPMLGVFRALFPTSSELSVRMILTLPQLVIIPSSLLSSSLVKRFGKKGVLSLALVLYLAGGTAGSLASSITFLLSTRVLLGVGVGLLFPVTSSLVSDFFSGKRRTRMMGLSTAVNNLGGVVATLTTGILAQLSWQLPFVLYLFALPVFVVMRRVLPVESSSEIQQVTGLPPKSVFRYILGILALNIVFYTIPSSTAMTIRELSLGSSLFCGIMLALQNGCSFLAGVFFPGIYQRTGSRIRYLAMGMMGLGFLLFSLYPTHLPLIVSLILIGSAYGLMNPYYLLQISNRTEGTQRLSALSLASCSMFLGQFLNPVILSFSSRAPMLVSAILILPVILTMGLLDLWGRSADTGSEGDEGEQS